MFSEAVIWLQAEQSSRLSDVKHGSCVQGVSWRQGGRQRILTRGIGSTAKAGKQRRTRVHWSIALVSELECNRDLICRVGKTIGRHSTDRQPPGCGRWSGCDSASDRLTVDRHACYLPAAIADEVRERVTARRIADFEPTGYLDHAGRGAWLSHSSQRRPVSVFEFHVSEHYRTSNRTGRHDGNGWARFLYKQLLIHGRGV